MKIDTAETRCSADAENAGVGATRGWPGRHVRGKGREQDRFSVENGLHARTTEQEVCVEERWAEDAVNLVALTRVLLVIEESEGESAERQFSDFRKADDLNK